MKVTFDDQIFSTQRRGGISRYFIQLIDCFLTNPDYQVEVFADWTYTVNEFALERHMGRALPTWAPGSKLGDYANGRLALVLNGLRATGKPSDLRHVTYYRPGRIHRGSPTPYVVTVYDMIPELLPQYFRRGNPHLAKRRYVESAAAVICISESTKRDLVTLWGEQFADAVVVPLAVDYRFWAGAAPNTRLPDEYVLFVGARAGYKDFETVVRAFAYLAAEHPRLELVAAGGGDLSARERRLLVEAGILNRVRQLPMDDRELASTYAGAQCFVFPSRYEGFGLPTLEAMAAGTPAVLASSSSHPEVGGDAAVYFTPGDAAELASAIHGVINDPSRRSELIERGRARARGFSWTSVATGTAAVYRSLVEA
jgi:glycosyltransferase involved in cell wall biosynthesis